MTTASKPAAPPAPEYSSEVRFGIVMYGGVSLAVYINGVANELYEMSCATPRGTIGGHERDATRDIYRRLAWLADNPSLRHVYAGSLQRRRSESDDVWRDPLLHHTELHPVRFVVDVISGTSAGGINGIFLAKALASGAAFKPLQELWVREGDIGVLLNDRRSYSGLPRRIIKQEPPASLLNGDRMYLKLCDALEIMDGTIPRGEGKPLVDEVDLFVTVTDIAGTPIPLKLSRQVVYEYRHKQNFHFSYAEDAGRNHFNSDHNGLLAFAARCTAAFPFAFEPFSLERVMFLKPEYGDAIRSRWPAYLSGLGVPQQAGLQQRHLARAYGDGGYLDNKPFTYVAQTLATRQSAVPVERKLIYVEPSPQAVRPDELPDAEPPNALQNSLAALAGIPRYETIREDLQEILKRNRSIERADRIIREGEHDLYLALYESAGSAVNPFVRIIKEGRGKVPPWPEFTRSKMVRYYGTAILAYRRLRVASTTDDMARCLAARWEIDIESDYLYALTALVRVWRDDHYRESSKDKSLKTINMFLDEFDLSYRIRKTGFLLRQIDHLRSLVRRRRDGLIRPDEQGLLTAHDTLSLKRLRSLGWDLLDPVLEPASLHRALEALHVLKIQLNDAQRKRRFQSGARMRPRRDDEGGMYPQLRRQLEDVLSLLLARPNHRSIRLQGISGKFGKVELEEATMRRAARAPTMQECVMERARGLLALARATEKTAIHEALEADLEFLRLPKIAPGAREILGTPELRLVPPFAEQGADAAADSEKEDERVEVDVQRVDNPPLDTPEGMLLRRLLGEHFLYFDLFDQMSFPLYHDAGIGEPATVEVSRISPPDATALVHEVRDKRHKLAGTALANFGAFIDRNWRLNDLMWGRLDGAEQLIRVLLPMQDPRTEEVRNELIRLAHVRILHETLVGESAGQLADALSGALAELRFGGDAGRQIDALLQRILPDGTRRQQQQQLAGMLTAFMNEQQLLRYVRDKRNGHGTDPKGALANLSRAVTIAGRMLEGISTRQDFGSFAFRWLARGGLMLQGLIAVSLPGSLRALWWGNLMSMIYLLGAVLALIGLVTASAQVFHLAVATLAITFILHVLSYMLGDVLRSHERWHRKGMRLAGIATIALAVVGGLSIYAKLQEWTNGRFFLMPVSATRAVAAATRKAPPG